MEKSRSKFVFAAALLWCGLASGALADEWRPDAWITTKAKIAMMTADGVSASEVNVDTVDGRVTLHGKVTSESEKQRAGEVAHAVEGVKDVRNLLQVVPAGAQKSSNVADGKLKEDVEKALKAEGSLDNSSIAVSSVNNGVVLLSGKASSLSDHLTAVEVARRVSGVRKVTSEIQSPDKVADRDVRKELDSSPRSDKGGGAGDAWITSATKMRLLANGETPALAINVDTTNSVVTLFGIVPTQKAKQEAEREARAVSGVKGVKNELEVVPDSKQDAVVAKDDDIKARVDDAFGAREPLKDTKIGVEVKNGVVRLTGSVPSNNHRLLAAMTARSVGGVRSVRDELTVQPSA